MFNQAAISEEQVTDFEADLIRCMNEDCAQGYFPKSDSVYVRKYIDPD